MKRFAILWAAIALSLAAGHSASADGKVLFDMDLSETKTRPISQDNLEKWRASGWDIRLDQLPSKVFSPYQNKGKGVLEWREDGEQGKVLYFKGRVQGPAARLEGLKTIVVSLTVRGGKINGFGAYYKTKFLGGTGHFSTTVGGDWRTLTYAKEIENKEANAMTFHLVSSTGVELADMKLTGYASPFEAYRAVYENYSAPSENLLKNGDMEQTTVMPPTKAKTYREEKGWNFGDEEKVVLPTGYDPHPSFKNKELVMIDDPAVAHGGRRCVKFTLVSSEGFRVKSGRQYRIGLWAKGSGVLTMAGACYGGPKGGFLGTEGMVTRDDNWALSDEWKRFEKVVSFTKTDEDGVIGIKPFCTVTKQGVGYMDDMAVYEMASPGEALEQIENARAEFAKVSQAQVQVGPEQQKALDFFISQADDLIAKLSATEAPKDLDGIANRAAALNYLAERIVKEILFP